MSMRKLLESIDAISESSYDKWDCAEESEIAYNKTISGEWDYNRFDDWVSRVKLEEYRNNCSDESMQC